MEEQPPQITNQSTTTTTAPPPPPLNQPSLLTRIPEIPISNLISRHLSTKLTINSTDSIQDLINQKSWKTLADVIANQIINTPSIEAESLLKVNMNGKIISKVQFRIENGDLIGLEPQLKPDEIHLHSLLDVAKGEWTSSESKCKDVLKTSEDFSTNLVLNNQLALSLLYQGKISEALEIMKSLVSSVKDTSLMDSLIFNLVTILELRSTTAQLEKIDLLNQIKNQVSIESLNPNVFKLD
ncbi:hypothetical protein DFH28DRAFT_899493 [Melampsora americana]|nr:hypothetical protein DFH28DRAFT_899493 [Melampsora americana]